MLRVIVSLTVSVVVLVFLVFLSFDSEISRAIAGADFPDFALFINFFTSGKLALSTRSRHHGLSQFPDISESNL